MPRVTASVLIGNSDDKLSQERWSEFIADVTELVEEGPTKVFFTGFASPTSERQNACWVFELEEHMVPTFRSNFAWLADRYRQDSIAFVVGTTELVKAQKPQ